MTSLVNPLANPKGIQLECEICRKPAHLLCTLCRVTYYCGKEHQNADWIGIHEKICSYLKVLRSPMPFIASQDERETKRLEMLELKHQLLDTTRTVGQKFLFQGRYEHAIPAAMQSLRFSIDLHGLASIELVPSYLTLAEASIGLGRLTQAEEYLGQAHWTVLKTPETDNTIRSRLHRILGLLCDAKADYQLALKQFALDIYYSSEKFEPDDIRTSGGYFYQGNVFDKLGQWPIADSLYRRVFAIWYEHLMKIYSKRIAQVFLPEGVSSAVAELTQKEVAGLDEAQEAEAIKVLNTLLEVYRTHAPPAPAIAATGPVIGKPATIVDPEEVEARAEAFKQHNVRLRIALAVLHYILKNYDQMATFAIEAKRLQMLEYALVPDEESARLFDELERLGRKFVPDFRGLLPGADDANDAPAAAVSAQ